LCPEVSDFLKINFALKAIDYTLKDKKGNIDKAKIYT
jgi:hypothetical protein